MRHFARCKLFALAMAPALVQAAEWSTGAGVATSAIYTDNVCLTSTDEQDHWVGTVTPDVRLRGEGARASMALWAAVEYNTLAGNSPNCFDSDQDSGNRDFAPEDLESLNPRLRFNGDAILVEDWFFLNTSAFADQNQVDDFAPGGEDNLNGTGNTNTTVSYSVNPYLLRRFKDAATARLGYTYSDQYNTAQTVDDSTSERIDLAINSGSMMPNLSLGLNADYRRVSYDNTDSNVNTEDTELATASVSAAYQIDRSWQVNGEAGQEWNDFESESNDIDGTWWDTGAQWTPNPRVSIGAGYGERFFGTTKRFDARYSHKRSSIRADYRETITFSRDLRGRDQFDENLDGLGDPDSEIPPGFVSAPTIDTNDPILDERFTLVYSFSALRTSVSVRGSVSQQTQGNTGEKSEFTFFGTSLSRSLSPKLSLNAGVNWSDRSGDDGDDIDNPEDINSDTWRYYLGLSRPLGTQTSASLRYQYSQRNADNPFDEYDENRVTLTLRHTF